MKTIQKADLTNLDEKDEQGTGPIIMMCALLLLFAIAIIYVGVSSF